MRSRSSVGLGVLGLCFLAATILLAACLQRAPLHRATVKLLVQRPSGRPPETDRVRFVETQLALLRTELLRQRTQARLGKSRQEISEDLVSAEVTCAEGTDIIFVSVESPSPEFAQEYTDAWAAEYLEFRAEQLTQIRESAVLTLTREINRLGQELKKADEQTAAYAREHGDSPKTELELDVMRQNRERLKRLHDALLQKLQSIEGGDAAGAWTVSLLEPAVVTASPRRRWAWR